MRYAVVVLFMLYAYAGGGLLNVMTTTLTTIMKSTLVFLLIRNAHHCYASQCYEDARQSVSSQNSNDSYCQ